MKLGTVAATACIGVATLGIRAGMVHAEPIEVDYETSGVEQSVSYRTVLSDLTKVVTAVDGGRFELADDGAVVRLKSDSGGVVAEVPLTFDVAGKRLPVAHEISGDGRELALTPKADAKEIGEMMPVNSSDRLMAEINKNVVGVVAGGLIGGLLGAILGMGFFSILTGPAGAFIGAVAGGYIMGGQPFADAMNAVLTGQI
ncbi:hypothetical protein ACFVMC_29145 [Nocardia sp. NPDC127579]|uniref:hypothetical protein n=1 Tax=Nocardia sp. NPDC127579 TaxID=3345402 RepID=UPI00363E7D54